MSPSPVRRATLADQVTEALVARICDLGLGPGDEIPSEGELAAEFGVNRLVVRETISTLAAREILTKSQGRRARVAVPSARVLRQLFDFRLRQQSLDQLDLLRGRMIIEVGIARLAAQAGPDPAALARCAAILDQMREATDDWDAYIALDLRFHRELAELAGSRVLVLLLDALEGPATRGRQASYAGRKSRGLEVSTVLAEHRAILAAVTAGDAELAAGTMRTHLEATLHDLRGEPTPTTQ